MKRAAIAFALGWLARAFLYATPDELAHGEPDECEHYRPHAMAGPVSVTLGKGRR